MAIAKFILCQVKDTDISLDVPLTLYRNALSARPAGHLDRPSMLIRLTVVHLQQFKKRQHEVDAAQATGLLHEAINLSSAESHEKRVATSLLQLHAGGKTDPVQAGGQSSVGQNFTPDLTEEELWTFSIRSLDRFQLFRNLADLQRAISALELFVWYTSVRDYRYIAGLVDLGVALLYRFERLGELGDLEQGISRFKDAIDFTPKGHPSKPSFLGNLGNSIFTRFKHIGELGDLEEAISMRRIAVDITPEVH